MEDGIAPTDTRHRPDQRLMEEGKWNEANDEKVFAVLFEFEVLKITLNPAFSTATFGGEAAHEEKEARDGGGGGRGAPRDASAQRSARMVHSTRGSGGSYRFHRSRLQRRLLAVQRAPGLVEMSRHLLIATAPLRRRRDAMILFIYTVRR